MDQLGLDHVGILAVGADLHEIQIIHVAERTQVNIRVKVLLQTAFKGEISKMLISFRSAGLKDLPSFGIGVAEGGVDVRQGEELLIRRF